MSQSNRFAAKESDQPAKRARPPKWSADVLDAFFDDAREKLVGTRPDYEQAATRIAPADADSVAGEAATRPQPALSWSKLIDAETIETEIKRLARRSPRT